MMLQHNFRSTELWHSHRVEKNWRPELKRFLSFSFYPILLTCLLLQSPELNQCTLALRDNPSVMLHIPQLRLKYYFWSDEGSLLIPRRFTKWKPYRDTEFQKGSLITRWSCSASSAMKGQDVYASWCFTRNWLSQTDTISKIVFISWYPCQYSSVVIIKISQM